MPTPKEGPQPTTLLEDPEKLKQRFLLSLLLQPPKSKRRRR